MNLIVDFFVQQLPRTRFCGSKLPRFNQPVELGIAAQIAPILKRPLRGKLFFGHGCTVATHHLAASVKTQPNSNV